MHFSKTIVQLVHTGRAMKEGQSTGEGGGNSYIHQGPYEDLGVVMPPILMATHGGNLENIDSFHLFILLKLSYSFLANPAINAFGSNAYCK